MEYSKSRVHDLRFTREYLFDFPLAISDDLKNKKLFQKLHRSFPLERTV